ncbi:hypothetical protein J3E64_001255 [Sphingobium sp. OAS761]|nr:hypothetical protein [Sphingobium sp. OAS761]
MGQVIVVHSVREVSNLACRDELESHLAGDPLVQDQALLRLHYVPTVTRDSFRTQGRISTLIEDGQLFETVNGLRRLYPATLVLDPAAVIILLAGRGNDGGVDQRPSLDRDRLRLELGRHSLEEAAVESVGDQHLAEAHEGCALRRRSVLEKPQKRRNDVRSSSASANFMSDRSYQIDSNSALNIANGGQAGSPFAAEYIRSRRAATGCQSISVANSSSEEPDRVRPAKPNRS